MTGKVFMFLLTIASTAYSIEPKEFRRRLDNVYNVRKILDENGKPDITFAEYRSDVISRASSTELEWLEEKERQVRNRKQDKQKEKDGERRRKIILSTDPVRRDQILEEVLLNYMKKNSINQ